MPCPYSPGYCRGPLARCVLPTGLTMSARDVELMLAKAMQTPRDRPLQPLTNNVNSQDTENGI
jgi:hypothetical protein